MTPKEKANQLRDKYIYTPFIIYDDYQNTKLKLMIHAKHSALISVNEIIKEWEYIDTYLANGMGKLNPNLKYWEEVKQEIEKL
jgi:hypothetical protein